MSQVSVKLYQPPKMENVTELLASDPKNTLKILGPDEIAERKKYLIGEGSTDASGDYNIQFDKSYEGGPVMVDIAVTQVQGQKKKTDKQVQFTVTVLQPAWRQGDNDYFYGWDYCLSPRFWCHIRSLFDAWVICGKVVSCKDKKTPLVAVEVTAFDADWLTDDVLGSTTTDATGHFRIDYTSADFKQTFLSPLINVETPFSSKSGPDVYFKVVSGGGTVLMEETRTVGLGSARRDVGHCFCLDLCVPFETIDTPEIASVWTGIGTAFTIPIGSDLNDFDPQGYAGTKRYGFTGKIRTTGQVAISSTNRVFDGNPYEYRFLVSDTVTADNGAAPLPASSFNKIVGVDIGLFESIKIGQMMYFGSPFKVVNIFCKLEDLDAEGWLDVNKSIERTFTEDPSLNVADLTDPIEGPLWNWIDLDGMMGIDTRTLTENSMPTVSAGDAVPVANRKGVEKIALRFELREVIDKPNNVFNYLPASGQTLNCMVVNNTAAVKELAVSQHLSTTDCSAVNGEVSVNYTAHHPELESVSLHLRSNDGDINTPLVGGGLPILNNSNPSVNHANSSSVSITGAPNTVALKTCSYILTLSVLRRLHTGDGAVGTNQVPRSFYYEAP